jgi:hypothetical protein
MLTDYAVTMASAAAMGLLAIALSVIVLLGAWQAIGWAVTQFFSDSFKPAVKPSSRI